MTRRSKPRPRWLPPPAPFTKPTLRRLSVALWGVYGLAQIVPMLPWNVIWDEWRVNGWPK